MMELVQQNVIESLALKGDISGLKPQEKVIYYAQLCERLGLDPLTNPFMPLKLNGKEVLYASKGATDQLARVHKVSRAITSREKIEDVYVVTARATLPDGRSEEAVGAVPLGNLKGDALANALMKAETKAKRRVTLSIIGLGMLDETELETIPVQAMQAIPAYQLPESTETPRKPEDTARATTASADTRVTIGADRAEKMKKELERLGFNHDEQLDLITEALGVVLSGLEQLTDSEAMDVWKLAKTASKQTA
jgi:hypothetical protein